MANKRVDPELKKFGVCGCVTRGTRVKIYYEAGRRGIKVGTLVGEIMETWGEGITMVEKDERQLSLIDVVES